MSAKGITDELVRQVAEDLRDRLELDEEEVRALGARLAEGPDTARGAETRAFAEEFSRTHRETFDRLAR